MNKMLATSTSRFALTSVVLTCLIYGVAVYYQISIDAQQKSKQLAFDETTAISEKEFNNLMIAALIGKVANATSDKKSIEYQEKKKALLSSYQLNSSQNHFNTNSWYSE